ncbi:MAG: hypothetical protein NT016_02110 [Candidatus Aenigmarchaeota archaeon]|nr:hypothetical protein [Candidatus Aenigmarchaeota archaeon]
MTAAAAMIVPSLMMFEQTIVASLSLVLLFFVIARRYRTLHSERSAESFEKLVFAFVIIAAVHVIENAGIFFGLSSSFGAAEGMHTWLELGAAAVFVYAALEIVFMDGKRS